MLRGGMPGPVAPVQGYGVRQIPILNIFIGILSVFQGTKELEEIKLQAEIHLIHLFQVFTMDAMNKHIARCQDILGKGRILVNKVFENVQ